MSLSILVVWHGMVIAARTFAEGFGKAYGILAGLNKLWDAGELSLGTKLQLLRACVLSVLLYDSERWTLKKEDERRVRAFEEGY